MLSAVLDGINCIPLVSFVYFLYFLKPSHSPTNPQNEKTGVFLFKLCHNPTKAYVVPYIPLVTLKYFFYFSEDIPQSTVVLGVMKSSESNRPFLSINHKISLLLST